MLEITGKIVIGNAGSDISIIRNTRFRIKGF
jgi:hypothetical protein